MLVMGRTGAAVPRMKELTGEQLDVVSANDVRMPNALVDFVVVDGSEPQLMYDLRFIFL